VHTNAVFRQYLYHEREAAVGYYLTPAFMVFAGGGRYATVDYRDVDAGPLFAENTLWEQLVLK